MNGIAILMYHSLDLGGSVVSVRPQLFAEQMSALADAGIRAISLREALSHRGSSGHWPARAAVLSFDDGFVNNIEYALPVLRKHNFTATLFAVSAHVGGRNNWGPPPARLGPQRLASWDHLKQWSDAGSEIGAHTRTHRDLRRVPHDELQDEITGSRDEIASRLGVSVEAFAYPYGGVSPAAAAIVKHEFRAACLTLLKRADAEPPHQLPRIDAYYLRTADSAVQAATGRLDSYLRLRRWGRTLRASLMMPAWISSAVFTDH